MSVVPLMFRDWWDELDFDRPSRLLDQHFGLGLRRDDLLSSLNSLPSRSMLRPGLSYFRPWRPTSLARQESASTINVSKDKFEVILDVQQFTPEEISVKTANNTIIVEGKHDEKQDEHGFVSRQFTRKYILPRDHLVEDVVSSLSSDGVLTISAPRRSIQQQTGERFVPITQIGPARTTPASTTASSDQPRVESPASTIGN